MERINTANKEIDLFGAGKHGFRDGSPGGGIFATFLSAAFFNAIQEEIANVVEAAGITLSGADRTQLRQAIEQMNAHGQCALKKSGANLLLLPQNGNRIKINGVSRAVPSGGVALAPSGLLPATAFRSRTSNVVTLTFPVAHNLGVGEYVKVAGVGGSGYNGLARVASTPAANSITYANTGSNEATTADSGGTIERDLLIFAYMSGATMTLEAAGRAVGHSTDATTGVEIKTGDPTRTLVGMARITAGPAWVSTPQQQFVISWFNRRGLAISAGPVSATTTATSPVELNAAARAELLTWPDDVSQIGVLSSASNTAAGGISSTAIGVNNATPANTLIDVQSFAANAVGNASHSYGAVLGEGYSYVTAVGSVSTGTGNWSGLSVNGLTRG